MKAKRVMQFLSIFALLVWGGVFLYFYLVAHPETGKPLIAKYVNADKGFDLWVLISGMGLIVLALFNFATFKNDAGVCTHDHAHGDECDHDHHHGDEHDHDHGADAHDHDHDQTASGLAFSILILIVPILVAANYSKNQFSNGYSLKQNQISDQLRGLEREKRLAAKEQIGNGAVQETVDEPNEADSADYVMEFTMADLEKMVPKNEVGNFLLDVPLIFNTAGDRQLMKVMEGIPVEFEAQVMEENFYNPEGNRIRAFRLMIECCAADARPLSIPVQFDNGLPEYEEMGWYKFTGNLTYPNEEGEHIAVLKVNTMDETAEVIEMIY